MGKSLDEYNSEYDYDTYQDMKKIDPSLAKIYLDMQTIFEMGGRSDILPQMIMANGAYDVAELAFMEVQGIIKGE